MADMRTTPSRPPTSAALLAALEAYTCPECGAHRPCVTSTQYPTRRVQCRQCRQPGKVVVADRQRK